MIAFLISSCLKVLPCLALEGADYIEFKVNEKTYNVPIPNRKTRDDFYYIQKALKGDRIAREIILGGKEEKQFFIGDEGVIRWLKITKYDQSVTEQYVI